MDSQDLIDNYNKFQGRETLLVNFKSSIGNI